MSNAKKETLEIRFLQSGLIKAVKPQGFDAMNNEERDMWADGVLKEQSDHELIEATYTLEHDGSSLHCSGVVFDEAPQVAAIESEYGENKLYSTKEWDEFTGCNSDEALVSSNPSMEEIRDLEKILEKSKEYYRLAKSKELVQIILEDEKSPETLKVFMLSNTIETITIEKVEQSTDYMPDWGNLLVLSNILMKHSLVMAESESFDEYYEYDEEEETVYSYHSQEDETFSSEDWQYLNRFYIAHMSDFID